MAIHGQSASKADGVGEGDGEGEEGSLLKTAWYGKWPSAKFVDSTNKPCGKTNVGGKGRFSIDSCALVQLDLVNKELNMNVECIVPCNVCAITNNK